MIGRVDRDMARQAFANLPEGTSWGERPALKQVYLPASHAKALDMNNQLVTGMRGAGKTFWWSALQERSVRQLVDQAGVSSALNERTEVRIGFGLKPAIDEYPSKDVSASTHESGRRTEDHLANRASSTTRSRQPSGPPTQPVA